MVVAEGVPVVLETADNAGITRADTKASMALPIYRWPGQATTAQVGWEVGKRKCPPAGDQKWFGPRKAALAAGIRTSGVT